MIFDSMIFHCYDGMIYHNQLKGNRNEAIYGEDFIQNSNSFMMIHLVPGYPDYDVL